MAAGQNLEAENITPVIEDLIEDNPYLLLGILFLNQFVLATLVLIATFFSKEPWKKRLDLKKISYPIHIWISLVFITIGYGSLLDLIFPSSDSVATLQTTLQSQSWGYR